MAIRKRVDKPGTTYVDFRGHLVVVRDDGSRFVSMDFLNDPGKTEQEHAPLCSLEYIISRYIDSDIPIQLQETEYQDFTDMPSYQDVMNSKLRIDNLWAGMPIPVKTAFNNDVAAFMNALQDPSMKDKLIDLGVLNRSTPQSGAASDGQEEKGLTSRPDVS